MIASSDDAGIGPVGLLPAANGDARSLLLMFFAGLRYASLPSSDQSIENFRPTNLPPKDWSELESHASEVRGLDAAFQKRMRDACVQRAVARLRREQEDYRLVVLNDLWLRRLLPDLAHQLTKGLAIGPEIDRAWRQGLPPRIRKVVWPLAIGNALRITPELFEICTQKAVEVRTLDGLIGTRPKGSQRRTCRVPTAATSSTASSSEASSCEQFPPPATEAEEDATVRASLAELVRNRELVCNREASIDCILPDVPRTFPSLHVFQTSGPLYGPCQRLLEAWVCYRPDVGYVQGMSFLAALLLVYLDVFPAFVCLCNLLSSPSLLGMYRMYPALIQKRYEIFDELLQREHPTLHQHLQAISFPKEMYLLEWFLTLFSKVTTVSCNCMLQKTAFIADNGQLHLGFVPPGW